MHWVEVFVLYWTNATTTVMQILERATLYFILVAGFSTFSYFSIYSDGDMTVSKLCPDGMVFSKWWKKRNDVRHGSLFLHFLYFYTFWDDYSPDQEKCDLPFNIDCSQRSKLRKCAWGFFVCFIFLVGHWSFFHRYPLELLSMLFYKKIDLSTTLTLL